MAATLNVNFFEVYQNILNKPFSQIGGIYNIKKHYHLLNQIKVGGRRPEKISYDNSKVSRVLFHYRFK